MIVVQETWICKPGQAGKFAKMCKQMISEFPEQSDVLTDMTGQFNKVVMISKYESLADYEKSFDKFMNDPEKMKKMEEMMKGYHDMFYTGSREVYKAW